MGDWRPPVTSVTGFPKTGPHAQGRVRCYHPYLSELLIALTPVPATGTLSLN